MFEVRKSIKRFRADPDWVYRRRAQEYLAGFDRGGYPFSLGPDGLAIRDLLQGRFHGVEVSLFHLLAWTRRGTTGSAANVASTYSVAVLPLRRALPATAFTSSRLSWCTREWKRRALPRTTGGYKDMPDLGTHLIRCVSTDPDFATLLNTYAMERLMHDARLGWRIEADRMIGWTQGRKTYEDLLAMTEMLVAIIDEFPEQAWSWPDEGRGYRGPSGSP
ncbi:hypothetical protein ACWIG5_28795 [Streptomyces lydicus]